MSRLSRTAPLAAFTLALFASATTAQTQTRLEIESREPIELPSAPPGTPAFERITGKLHFQLDPSSPYNARIVDLALCETNEKGLVESSSDLVLLQPIDPEQRSTLLLEVCNRGGQASLRYFQRASRGRPYGDLLLMKRGVSIAWVGWQHDVPRGLKITLPKILSDSPLTGPVRCDWVVDQATDTLGLGHRNHRPYPIHERKSARLTRRAGRDAEREELPRDSWRFTDDGESITASDEKGFAPGFIYELVYTATDPVPVGLGLAAVRDAATFFKDDEGPVAVDSVVAVGISQTGRFLRHFLYQGFSTGADGEQSLDGMLALTAGAGRGSFNHRFAQPSRDAHRYSAFFYPTDLFPFASYTERDLVTKREDSLIDHLFDPYHLPKTFWINTGYEYWGRAAALVHTSTDAKRDLAPFPFERIYHLANCQHFPGSLNRGNPIELLSLHRALCVSMIDWVRDGTEPPRSRFPRLDRNELVEVKDYELPEGYETKLPKAAHNAYRADYGPRWEQGLIDKNPPELGEPFPALVPKLDDQGREMGGVQPLETRIGLGVFLPWSLRPDGELNDFVGSFLPAKTLPEPDKLQARIEQGLRDLRSERLLLPEDEARLRAHVARLVRSVRGD